ncbi:MAG: putative sulfate/molybdate transporter [Carboxydocellales bacterium]
MVWLGGDTIAKLKLNEVSGALGDLGTFLPHVIGAITLASLNPAGVFTMFGLLYVASGLFYRIPMAVQPMKAASAAILIQQATPGEIAAAGLILGSLLTFLAFSGLMEKLAKITPRSITSGIQLGLGFSLALLGFKLVSKDLVLGILVLVVMLPFSFSKSWPGAITGVIVGVVYSFLSGKITGFPQIQAGFYLPPLVLPTMADVQAGIFKIVIPQLPLTITNAIIISSLLAKRLFPQANRVNVRNLALTQGLGNLIAAPFGGYLMCHGGGGLVAHHRFGARTWAAPVMLGTCLLLAGLFLGHEALKIFRLIPEPALGALLVYGGLDLARSMEYPKRTQEMFVILVVSIISVWTNPSWGYLLGLPIVYGINKGWLKP